MDKKYLEYNETEPSKFFLYSRNNWRDIDTLLRPEIFPEKKHLFDMANFSSLYLSDDNRHENYQKTGKVVLRELDDTVGTWEEYFQTKFYPIVDEMREKDKKEYKDSEEEAIYTEETIPWISGNLDKFYAMNPYSRFSIEEEERLYDSFYDSWGNGGVRDRDVPDWYKYMNNRERRIKLMTTKTAKQQKLAQEIIQGEEMQAKLTGNKHLLKFIEKLNNEVKEKPKSKPQVKKVVKTVAKAKPASKAKTVAKAKPASKAKTTTAKVTKPKVTKTKTTTAKVTKPKVTKTKPKVTKTKTTEAKVTKPKVTKAKTTTIKVTKPKITKKTTKPIKA